MTSVHIPTGRGWRSCNDCQARWRREENEELEALRGRCPECMSTDWSEHSAADTWWAATPDEIAESTMAWWSLLKARSTPSRATSSMGHSDVISSDADRDGAVPRCGDSPFPSLAPADDRRRGCADSCSTHSATACGTVSLEPTGAPPENHDLRYSASAASCRAPCEMTATRVSELACVSWPNPPRVATGDAPAR